MADLALINSRVDEAIKQNKHAERLVLVGAGLVFVLGAALVVVGYNSEYRSLMGVGGLLQGFLYWPMQAVLRIRRDNLILQTLPVLVSALPPKAAADEISKALAKVMS